jgi:hypothetical protein
VFTLENLYKMGLEEEAAAATTALHFLSAELMVLFRLLP